MALEDAKTQIDLAFTGTGRGLAFENAFGGALSAFRRRYSKDLAGSIWRSRVCPSFRR